MIASPCVKTCKLDPAQPICMGCFRTLGEIGGWSGFTDAQRAAVMAALPERAQRYQRVGSHITISGT